MKIRLKIILGFSILALMLATAGVFTIYEFTSISKSVIAFLDDNYKTIKESRKMLEALEREDSGILLLMLGKWEEGRNTITDADHIFRKSFEICQNNITEKGEDNYIQNIKIQYDSFLWVLEKPIVNTPHEGNIDWYFREVYPKFISVKNTVNDLMNLNQYSMHEEALYLRDKAKRAIMPGIVAMISAIIFVFLFSFLFNFSFVKPIKRINKALENQSSESYSFNAQIDSNDEIKLLERNIEKLIHRVKR